MEYLLYGLARNETRDYMETLLLCTTKKSDIEKVKVLAGNDGFHTFRVATFNNGDMPDFAKTVNI